MSQPLPGQDSKTHNRDESYDIEERPVDGGAEDEIDVPARPRGKIFRLPVIKSLSLPA